MRRFCCSRIACFGLAAIGLCSVAFSASPLVLHEAAILAASNGGETDQFGVAVDIDGDTAVVGAPLENSGSGVVYVYERDEGGAGNWGLIATLSDASGSGIFGRAVAIDGDIVAVGAPFGNSFAGAAYVFSRNQGGANEWGLVKTLLPDDPLFLIVPQQFGFSVDVSGNRVVVGSPLNLLGIPAGSVYVFSKDLGGADNWGQETRLTTDGTAIPDWFPLTVSITDDPQSGDVYVCVATPGESNGIAHLFERSSVTSQWEEKPVLHPSDVTGQPNNTFGASISLDGGRLAVGADRHDETGVVYIFERGDGASGTWQETTKLLPLDAFGFDRFGFALRLDGDRLAIGAHQEDGSVDNLGVAYVFERDSTGSGDWDQLAKILAVSPAVDDQLGSSVAVSGDTVLLGAPADAIFGGDDEGFALIFEVSGATVGFESKVGALALLEDAANETIDLATAFSGLGDPDPTYSILLSSSFTNLTGLGQDLFAANLDNGRNELVLDFTADAYGFGNVVVLAETSTSELFQASFLFELLSVNDEPTADF